jgi:hypothetical protein
MSHLAWFLHPVGFLAHCLHVESRDPRVARDATPASSAASRSSIRKARGAKGTGRRRVDRRSDYHPGFIEEMVMDLP